MFPTVEKKTFTSSHEGNEKDIQLDYQNPKKKM